MSGAGRDSWTTTTHVWAHDVDREHLESMRRTVGEVGPRELVHLVLEVLAYADDEAEARQVRGRVDVRITDRSVSITDDGRGTDTRLDAGGAVIRKPVMATADVRFGDDSPLVILPDGERRRGMSSVAAVTPELVHENRRADGAWSQTYRYGAPVDRLESLGDAGSTGTTVRIERLDPTVVAALDVEAFASAARRFSHVDVTIVDDREKGEGTR